MQTETEMIAAYPTWSMPSNSPRSSMTTAFAVDHLMCFFADELRAAGRGIGGIVKLPPDEDTERADRVLDLMTGDVFPIKQKLGRARPPARSIPPPSPMPPRASPCRRCACRPGDDLEFSSRRWRSRAPLEFGAAVAAGLPVLTSIKRRRSNPGCVCFTGGIGTLLACRLRVLRDWWRDRWPAPRSTSRRRGVRRQPPPTRAGGEGSALSGKQARGVSDERRSRSIGMEDVALVDVLLDGLAHNR